MEPARGQRPSQPCYYYVSIICIQTASATVIPNPRSSVFYQIIQSCQQPSYVYRPQDLFTDQMPRHATELLLVLDVATRARAPIYYFYAVIAYYNRLTNIVPKQISIVQFIQAGIRSFSLTREKYRISIIKKGKENQVSLNTYIYPGQAFLFCRVEDSKQKLIYRDSRCLNSQIIGLASFQQLAYFIIPNSLDLIDIATLRNRVNFLSYYDIYTQFNARYQYIQVIVNLAVCSIFKI